MNSLLLIGAGASTFCGDASEILKLVGWALTIFKIAIPLFIIALGLIDLGKAAISSKPEEVKKCATSMLWRLVGGAVIFFVPTIIMLAFGFVGGFNDSTNQVDFNKCYDCVVSPWNSNCSGY